MQSVLERKHSKAILTTNLPAKNGKPTPYRWTVNEYYRMGDMGFFSGKRVQLIRGEIIQMSPMKSPHATSIQLAFELLTKVFQKGFVVRPQLPMSFSKFDEPEPDIAVVEGTIRDYVDSHPQSAVLLVEVADSSLRFDRKQKAELYAENMIGEYWIVNLKERSLEVNRQPVQNTNLEFSYSERLVVGETESIAPLAKPSAKIKVADMMP